MRRAAILLVVAVTACTPPEPPPPPQNDAGVETPPPATCPPGQMLFPGSKVCEPGDWKGCGTGFEPDESGWGCKPILPTQLCTGATREALGQTACQPIGNCSAPPPSSATHFVDGSRTGPDDATHFRTLTAALNAVPTGATIFIYPGQYIEALTLSRAVKLIGQCPAQTSLVGTSTWPAVRVLAAGVSLEGLTLRGGYTGISVAGNGSVTAKSVVVDGNQGIGISLAEAGSALTLSDCAIRNTTSNNMGTAGWGVSIQNGSTATITDCAVNMNTVTGLRASGLSSSITASRVSIRDTRAGTVNDWGRGAVAQSGAKLTFDHVAISGSAETGLVLAVGATGVLTDIVVSNTTTNSAGLFGRAINVADESRLTLTRATLSRNKDASLMVVGQGAFADVRDSVVHSTTRAKDDVARGITVQEGAGLALSGSAVVGSVEGGVVIVDEGTWASLGRCAVFQTASDGKGGFGHGIVTGLSNVNIRGCQIGGSAGIGLAVGPGSVVADELTLTTNGTGVFVDRTVSFSVVEQVPATAGTDEAFLSSSSRFIGNAENSGSGALALPAGLFR